MPARSSLDPTRNHIHTLMIGALWISFNKTIKPFDNLVRVKLVSIALKFHLPLFGGMFLHSTSRKARPILPCQKARRGRFGWLSSTCGEAPVRSGGIGCMTLPHPSELTYLDNRIHLGTCVARHKISLL